MKKLYYIGHYSDPAETSNRKAAPAADTKMDYIIEQHSDEYIRINFDITMTRLSCDLASLDVVNQMGTHKV